MVGRKETVAILTIYDSTGFLQTKGSALIRGGTRDGISDNRYIGKADISAFL